jgi:3,4-dihydroxy 2-butanone 4-phosphate synthase/GTP cyclohydrolase II
LVEAGRLLSEESSEAAMLFYLEQEGRGAGLSVKARAYEAEANRGVDSFTFYEELGLISDLRTYVFVVRVLRGLGVHRIRLLTNNPAKCDALVLEGIDVIRVPLIIETGVHAKPYMDAKRKRGHLL